GCVCTGVLAPGAPPARLMRSRYSGAVIGGTGPISTTLLLPRDDSPFGPSVNNQTLPATSAASAVGPAAACACASVGKLSIRQNNGPSGKRVIFFSTTGLTSNVCAVALDGDSNSPAIATAHAESVDEMTRVDLKGRPFINAPLKLHPTELSEDSGCRLRFA